MYGSLPEKYLGKIKSSTFLELYGLGAIIWRCFDLLKGCTFYGYLDNASAVIGLGGRAPQTALKFYGRSRKPDIQELIIWILDMVALGDMQFEARWLPRELIQRADDNLHENEHSHYGYSVKPYYYNYVVDYYGQHTVDRFTEPFNVLVPSKRFNSQFLWKTTEWTDAFTCDWSHEVNWIHPPYCLICNVVAHLRRCRCDATLVVPRWSGAQWWPILFPGKGKRADFVSDILFLGPSSEVLEYKGAGECNLPRADQILALKIRF